MRLIDADKVMEEIHRMGGHNLCGWETIGVKALIDRQPTVDIKTEVAREIFAEIEKAHENCIYINPTNNIGSLQVNKFEGMLTELKNKYTEGNK